MTRRERRARIDSMAMVIFILDLLARADHWILVLLMAVSFIVERKFTEAMQLVW